MMMYICMACQTRIAAAVKPRRCIKPSCQKGGGFIREFDAASYALAGMENVGAERYVAQGEALAAEMTARLRSARGDVSAKAGRMERDSPLFFGTGDNPGLFG